MLSVLRNETYRRLLAAQIVALVGTGLLTVALGLLAYDLAGSNAGAVLGVALTIKMLAYVGLAPVINALAVRWPKKRVLIAADLVRAAMALCLPFITDVWQIYLVIFLLQSASATFTPAFQALIPTILTKENEYTLALSLSRLAYDMEALVSPAVAALLLTLVSYNNLFIGTAAGFLFSASMVTVTVLPRLAAPTGPQPSLWHRTTLGTRIFCRDGRLRSLLALNLVVAAPTALVLVNTVVFVRDVLQRPGTDLALALACFGVGSMIVALSAPRVLARFGDRSVMLTGAAVIPLVLAGASALTLPGVPGMGWWPLLGLWFLLGAANSTILTPSSRLLRDASTEETRPYVFTAQFSLSHACYILTYPLAGWVGAVAGLGWAALALAIIAMIGSAGAFLSWPGHEDAANTEPAEKEPGIEYTPRQPGRPRS
ncbi:MFS transporter [Arthrobacter sp. Leaf141]|uniref:MFS transporter n=1 Tax=Arthrobacter sp. Leaf141 TaxID=1736273 RepID=UPI0006FD3583|nr:MFS transporter [Arthrobacter sp. Leaf141]KQQ99316.1 MFS transporter [Arthrobacter sp. Leaf141]